MLLKNLKLQKTNDKPVRLLADKFQLIKTQIPNEKVFGHKYIWVIEKLDIGFYHVRQLAEWTGLKFGFDSWDFF